MNFRCDEGHLVVAPWGKLRGKIICPVCKGNVTKQIAKIDAVPKKEGVYRIIALDQATHNTGYSVYDDQVLVSYGVYQTNKSTIEERISDVCDWLDSMIAAWKPDEVGIEETQYQAQSGIGHDVFKILTQLMGAIMITTIRQKVKISRVLIATWRHHCGVKGRVRSEQKASAQQLVKNWYDIKVTDDESDAICIGKYFADNRKKNGKISIGEI